MTVPYLMNCQHQSEGWCLECVGALHRRCVAALDALLDIEQAGHNPADLCPDLIGKPDRYSIMVDRLADRAMLALNEDRKNW